MFGKKILIVVIAVGVLSFGASFFVSGWLVKEPQPASKDDGDKKQLRAILAGLDAGKLNPKERYLDDLIKDLKRKNTEYELRERQLREREKQVAIAQDHLHKEAEKLDNLRVELVAPITRLKEAQARVESARIMIGRMEKVNIKWLASVYEKMDAAAGAKIIEKMCKNRKEDEAAKILRNMSERSAGKIMAELTDQDLAARLSGMLKSVSEEG